MSNGDRNKETKIWDEKKSVKYLKTGSVIISLEPTMLQVDFRWIQESLLPMYQIYKI